MEEKDKLATAENMAMRSNDHRALIALEAIRLIKPIADIILAGLQAAQKNGRL